MATGDRYWPTCCREFERRHLVLNLQDREKAEKVLRLALCPSSPEGEWSAAAVAFFRTLRSAGARAEDILNNAPAVAHSHVFPFGKFKGRTVAQVARESPSYLEWVLINLTKMDPSLRKEILTELRRHDVSKEAP
jgi:hypothetical protein